MRIVGLDVGNEISVACVVNLSDFHEFPHSKANEFFDELDFHFCTLDQDGLNKLKALKGDVYVYEPTGSYHQIWTDNLEMLGLAYRQVANTKLVAYRGLLEFPKDDPHDALALTYYFKDNKDNPRAFLRVRETDLQIVYSLLFEIERVNKELRPIKARARILLHREFPEYSKKEESPTGVWGLWKFIAGHPTKTKIFQQAYDISIGSAKRNSGFSQELKELSETILIRMQRKIDCQELIKSAIYAEKYQDYHLVFDKFNLGDMVRAIILCQIYPFETFLDENGKELKRKIRNRKTAKGHPTYKRIAYRRFHSLLGKGIKRKQSGQVDIKYVTGSKICRNLLTLWVSGSIINTNLIQFTPMTSLLLDKYHNDVNASTTQLEKLKSFSDDELKEAKPELRKLGDNHSTLRRIGELLADIIEDMEKKKKSKESLGKKGNKILHQWAKARVSDKAVKLLFHELVRYWQEKYYS
jgi:hypothetical protein